jgi:hypothetical protein
VLSHITPLQGKLGRTYRFRSPRSNRVYANAAGGELKSNGFGQTFHCVFGRRINATLRKTENSGHARDIDDGATTICQHGRTLNQRVAERFPYVKGFVQPDESPLLLKAIASKRSRVLPTKSGETEIVWAPREGEFAEEKLVNTLGQQVVASYTSLEK